MNESIIKAGDLMADRLVYISRTNGDKRTWKCSSCGRFDTHPRGAHTPDCPVSLWWTARSSDQEQT